MINIEKNDCSVDKCVMCTEDLYFRWGSWTSEFRLFGWYIQTIGLLDSFLLIYYIENVTLLFFKLRFYFLKQNILYNFESEYWIK